LSHHGWTTDQNLPKELRRKLKTRAAANRRSWSCEAITILESVLYDRSRSPTLDELDHLRAQRPVAAPASNDRPRSPERALIVADTNLFACLLIDVRVSCYAF
jgi:plasmid stability protein